MDDRALYEAVRQDKLIVWNFCGVDVHVPNVGLLDRPQTLDLQIRDGVGAKTLWTPSAHARPVVVRCSDDEGCTMHVLADARLLDLALYTTNVNGLDCHIYRADDLPPNTWLAGPRPPGLECKRTRFGYTMVLPTPGAGRCPLEMSDNTVLVYLVGYYLPVCSGSLESFMTTHEVQGCMHRLSNLRKCVDSATSPYTFGQAGGLTLEGVVLFKTHFGTYLRTGLLRSPHFGTIRTVKRTSVKMPKHLKDVMRSLQKKALGNGVTGVCLPAEEGARPRLRLYAQKSEQRTDVKCKGDLQQGIGLAFLEEHVHRFIQAHGDSLIDKSRQLVDVRVLFVFADGSYLAEEAVGSSGGGGADVIRIYTPAGAENAEGAEGVQDVQDVEDPYAFEEGGPPSMLVPYDGDLTTPELDDEYHTVLATLVDDRLRLVERVQAALQRAEVPAKARANQLFLQRFPDLSAHFQDPGFVANAATYMQDCLAEARGELCGDLSAKYEAARAAKRRLQDAEEALFKEYGEFCKQRRL